MWRCVPLSGFYSPHHCRPGSVDPLVEPGLGPVPAAAPSRPVARVLFNKIKRNKRAGTAFIRVHVSSSGYLVSKGKTVRKVVRRPRAAKTLWLPVQAKGRALKTLKEKGHVKVGVRVIFVPAEDERIVMTRKLTLVMR
jgi:hypothetical protein